MYQRMAIISQKLQAYGLSHESFTRVMLQRMSGDPDPTSLQVLADVVQPPQGYQRESLKHYDTSSPLNALVDAVLPENKQARKFSELVKAIVAGKASPQQWQAARVAWSCGATTTPSFSLLSSDHRSRPNWLRCRTIFHRLQPSASVPSTISESPGKHRRPDAEQSAASEGRGETPGGPAQHDRRAGRSLGTGRGLSAAVICPHWVPQVPILGPRMLLIQCS